MRSTVVGPYPRVGSYIGNILRDETNKLYGNQNNFPLVEKLREYLTAEVVAEQLAAGIDVPNCGFIDVHDERTWPTESLNVEEIGMKKIDHTNTHYKERAVRKKLRALGPVVGDSYLSARNLSTDVKLELPGPYALAKHSVIEDGSYRDSIDLAFAYADVYKEELDRLGPKDASLIWFDEPTIVAKAADPDGTKLLGELYQLPELYRHLVRRIDPDIPVALCTYYGPCTPEKYDILRGLQVDVLCLDFVWGKGTADLLREYGDKTPVGIGIVDSGDRAIRRFEDPAKIAERVSALADVVDLENSFISPNATLAHLDRDDARRKIAIVAEAAKIVRKAGF
jgi:methionine synthase II (cobalamin-independent)